jgi:hypothetical protein
MSWTSDDGKTLTIKMLHDKYGFFNGDLQGPDIADRWTKGKIIFMKPFSDCVTKVLDIQEFPNARFKQKLNSDIIIKTSRNYNEKKKFTYSHYNAKSKKIITDSIGNDTADRIYGKLRSWFFYGAKFKDTTIKFQNFKIHLEPSSYSVFDSGKLISTRRFDSTKISFRDLGFDLKDNGFRIKFNKKTSSAGKVTYYAMDSIVIAYKSLPGNYHEFSVTKPVGYLFELKNKIFGIQTKNDGEILELPKERNRLEELKPKPSSMAVYVDKTNNFYIHNSKGWYSINTSKRFFKKNNSNDLSDLFAPSIESNSFKINYYQGFYSSKNLMINNRRTEHFVIDTAANLDLTADEKCLVYGDLVNLNCINSRGKKEWEVQTPDPSDNLKTSVNGPFFVSLTKSRNLDFRRIKDGQLFTSLYFDTTSMDWVLWTPSGYYDCSPGGEKLIGWSVSRGEDSLPAYYPASRFRERFYRPDVVDSALKYCSEEIALKKLDLKGGKKVQKQMVKSLPPIIQITSPSMNEFFSDTLVKVNYALQNGSSAVHTIKVLVNGRPLQEHRPERSGGVTVKLPAEDCTVGLVAVSASGESAISFSRLIWNGIEKEADPYRKANLFILAVGISKYKLENLRLNFAAKDAKDFSNVLKKQAETGLYGKIEIKLLTDSLASRENIEDGLEWLQKQTTSRDVAMIFLAGHGENDENNRFYFLPHGGDFERKMSTCIPYTTFKSAIEALPGKVVVFADACRSGNFFGDLTRREVDVDLLSRELSSGAGGAVVFTSSSRKQSSLENPAWGNGAFTKALVEGLEGKADPYQKNYISVQSLNAYISHRVNELTGGMQKPNIIIPESMPDFAVAVKR